VAEATWKCRPPYRMGDTRLKCTWWQAHLHRGGDAEMVVIGTAKGECQRLADHVLRRLNSHQPLLDACKALRFRLNWLYGMVDVMTGRVAGQEVAADLVVADAAIALAKPKDSPKRTEVDDG